MNCERCGPEVPGLSAKMGGEYNATLCDACRNLWHDTVIKTDEYKEVVDLTRKERLIELRVVAGCEAPTFEEFCNDAVEKEALLAKIRQMAKGFAGVGAMRGKISESVASDPGVDGPPAEKSARPHGAFSLIQKLQWGAVSADHGRNGVDESATDAVMMEAAGEIARLRSALATFAAASAHMQDHKGVSAEHNRIWTSPSGDMWLTVADFRKARDARGG